MVFLKKDMNIGKIHSEICINIDATHFFESQGLAIEKPMNTSVFAVYETKSSNMALASNSLKSCRGKRHSK